MNPKFAALVETLAPKLEQLLAMPPLAYGTLPRDMPKSGVYLFTEAGRHLYVGRSNVLRGRYGRHCRPGATYQQAAFAFLLARNVTGRTVATYRPGEGSRAGLMLDPGFAAAFTAAKERIRVMEYRYVEEADARDGGSLHCSSMAGTAEPCGKGRPEGPCEPLRSSVARLRGGFLYGSFAKVTLRNELRSPVVRCAR
jgi:hypothetical protein